MTVMTQVWPDLLRKTYLSVLLSMWLDPIHPGPRRIMDFRLLPIADMSVLTNDLAVSD